MRRKVALFTNGWGNDFLREVGKGIFEIAKKNDIDIFVFVDYTSHGDLMDNLMGELNIFKLPNLNEFDGAIIAANTFNTDIEVDYLQKAILKASIPTVSLESRMSGADYIGVDDAAGMKELTEHLISEHDCRSFIYMGGIKGHLANNIRFGAVNEVLEKHHITIPKENILCADFTTYKVKAQMDAWFSGHVEMVDAIICANDNMAMGVCDWLRDHDFSVPGDVKVTGFDCIGQALAAETPITSVNREWVSMGMHAMSNLLLRIEKKGGVSEENLKSVVVYGKSCCSNISEEAIPDDVKERIKSQKYVKVDGFTCDQHFRHMYRAMRKADNSQDLYDSLESFFLKASWLEGPKVMLCLTPDFFRQSGTMERLYTDGYPDQVEVACAVGIEKINGPVIMSKDEAICMAANQSSEPGVYLFIPLRSDGVPLGFAMQTCGFDMLENSVLYIWTRHMNQYLEQVKSNVVIKSLTSELEALSVRDTLTGKFSRNGCEKIIYPRIKEWQENGGKTVILFADLDHLKVINDTYGHNSGDLAICTMANALEKALGNDYMIARLGGDEFFIAGFLNEDVDMKKLVKNAEVALVNEKLLGKIPFRLSMSIGGIQMKVGEIFDEEITIKSADALMYEMKETHHKAMDK